MTTLKKVKKVFARFAASLNPLADGGTKETKGDASEPAPQGKEKSAEKAAIQHPSLADDYAEAKARLRTLIQWIVASEAAIATVFIAGSQLTDLGDLDTEVGVSLFGWEATRFDFAVVGLAAGVGGAMLTIALAVWVQTSAHVTLGELEKFPEAPGARPVAWRVRAKVRQTIEHDLKTRTNDLSATVASVTKDWAEARANEWRHRGALIALSDRAGCRRVPVPKRDQMPIDWADGATLAGAADAIADTCCLKKLTADQEAALDVLESKGDEAYKNSQTETITHWRVVSRMLSDASYLRMALSFRMVLKYMVGLAVVSAMGIAMFVWASHPPEDGAGAPTFAVIPLADVDQRTYLGSGCDPSSLKIEAVADAKVAIVSASALSKDEECVLEEK